MKITSFNINNLRRLYKVKIDITDEKTIFVGANNSEMIFGSYALKCFYQKMAKSR